MEVYETLPIVPLRDVVVFPHMMMPFVIGRPSSTRALDHALLKDKRIFLAAQHDASVDEGRPITNGIIMCGKTTTSRRGTIGRVSYTSKGVSIYPAFSINAMGLSFAITTSRVIVTSRTFFWLGT